MTFYFAINEPHVCCENCAVLVEVNFNTNRYAVESIRRRKTRIYLVLNVYYNSATLHLRLLIQNGEVVWE